MPRVKKAKKAGLKVVSGNASEAVVEGMAEATQKTPKVRDYSNFYSKYPHVVPGSVREPTAADLAVLTKSHGRVCTVRCVDCQVERTINLQDAFQVTRCPECKQKAAKERRQARRQARQAKRQSA